MWPFPQRIWALQKNHYLIYQSVIHLEGNVYHEKSSQAVKQLFKPQYEVKTFHMQDKICITEPDMLGDFSIVK
jgi:hypothetical protein